MLIVRSYTTKTAYRVPRLNGSRKVCGAVGDEAAAEDQVHRPRDVVAEDDLDDIAHLTPPRGFCFYSKSRASNYKF